MTLVSYLFLLFFKMDELIFKFNVRLKTLLREAFRNQNFKVTWFTNLKKTCIGRNEFSFQFRKIIAHYRRIGYTVNVMRQSARLVFSPMMVDNSVCCLV